ncbi:MAG: hypothetical protein ACRDH9_01615 [Actinomycetota bacterium]
MASAASSLKRRGYEPELGAADVLTVVIALLDGIERGELDATEREVEFLSSVRVILVDAPE